MRKPFLSFLTLVFACATLSAQTVLPQWLFISSGETIYSVEQGVNNGNMSRTDFLKRLMNEARLSVAKQVSVHIASEENLFQQSLDGYASTRYFSRSTCSTDASMHLLRTDSHYDEATKKGSAIAQVCYIKKTPFLSLRVISDSADSDNNLGQYINFWDEAPKASVAVSTQLVRELQDMGVKATLKV